MNKNDNSKNIPKYIMGVVFTTFLSVCISPLFQSLIAYLQSVGDSFLSAILDNYYQDVAGGNSLFTLASVDFVIYTVFGAAFGYFLSKIFIDLSESKKRWIDISAKIASIRSKENKTSTSGNVSTGSTPKCLDYQPVTVRLDKIEESIDHADALIAEEISNIESSERRHYRLQRVWLVFLSTALILFFLFAMFYHSYSSFVQKETVRITNNIEIVSPYISDLEYRQLKSEYHSMKNADDHAALMSRLRAIADAYGLDLLE